MFVISLLFWTEPNQWNNIYSLLRDDSNFEYLTRLLQLTVDMLCIGGMTKMTQRHFSNVHANQSLCTTRDPTKYT